MNSDLVEIVHVNESYIRILANDSIREELSDQFTFYAPGFQYMKAFKLRAWNGKIRLFNRMTSTIYKGLLSDIIKFCNDRNYTFQIDEKLKPNPIKTFNSDQFFTDLDIHAHHDKIEVRDYQKIAFEHCINHDRALIQLPTGSGKSLVMYTLCRYFLEKENASRILIVVPSINLVEQLTGDFDDYNNERGGKYSDKIHKIYGGQEKNLDKPITISTWQSLKTFSPEFMAKFTCILVDEVHLASAKVLKGIMEDAVLTKYRYGFTGSLSESECNTLVVNGLFGDIIEPTSTRALIDCGSLSDLEIRCLVLNHGIVSPKPETYPEEMDYLVRNKKRNDFLSMLVKTLKGNTLLLTNRIDSHARPLYDQIQKILEGTNRKVYMIIGKTESEEREQVRKLIETEKDSVIIGSVSIMGTGVNIRQLQNIIFATPTKSLIRVLQSIGRGLRTAEGKKLCYLYDISDDLRGGTKKANFTLSHFMLRLEIYQKQEFNFTVKKIRL